MSQDLDPVGAPLSSYLATGAFDAVPFPIFIHQADGTLAYLNPAAVTLWGVPSEAAVGKFNVLQQEDAFDPGLLTAFREVAAGNGPRVTEPAPMDLGGIEALAEYSGKLAWIESTLFPLNGPDGRPTHIVTFQRDVTDAVEKREDLRRASVEITEQRELIARLEAAQREIADQRAMIQELQSPIIEVWDGVLTMPILGMLTRARADGMLGRALDAVASSRAKHFILDLTGSEEMDTATTSHLLSIVRAIALLGAEAMIVGIRPHTAQAMASLGLGLEHVRTYRNLRDALRHCVIHPHAA